MSFRSSAVLFLLMSVCEWDVGGCIHGPPTYPPLRFGRTMLLSTVRLTRNHTQTGVPSSKTRREKYWPRDCSSLSLPAQQLKNRNCTTPDLERRVYTSKI